MNILITVYNSICFGYVKETSQRDVSFTYTKHIADREDLRMWMGIKETNNPSVAKGLTSFILYL